MMGNHPEWVASLNSLGENLGDAGRSMVSLDQETVLRAAVENTGLDDFGDDWFRKPLRLLLRSLEQDAELTLLGRIMARSDVQRFLQNRLRIEDTWKRHPEIADETIENPIFVCGLGRSGTTLLHELLCQDPAHRLPLLWELMFSVPPPETATYDSDPRIGAADRDIKLMDYVDPESRSMHVNGGDLPTECIFIFALQFQADIFIGEYNIPGYSAGMSGVDPTPVYEYHKRVLQLLQWKHRKERWVLKTPAHLGRLHALFAVYPDARVVVTHRDPLRAVSSLASLTTSLKAMRSNKVRADADRGFTGLGQIMLLEHYTRLRDELGDRAKQIVDVRYQDLVEEPVAVLASMYAQWGLPFSAEAEARMRAYVAEHPRGKHGAHEYSFADTGLDLTEERAKLAAYQARFNVPSEV